jgi:3D (Asp-Asp-Asp) domain-containing protein
MKKKLSKKTRATVVLYSYILLVYGVGFTCGMITANAGKGEAVEAQTVQATQEPTQTATAAPVEYKQMTLKASAYCPCSLCCGKCDGITATGTKATAGRTVAVDPSVIPYGTEIIINGNTYIAEDCGGAIKGNKIDIYFATHQEALNFGRQTVTAYIKAA